MNDMKGKAGSRVLVTGANGFIGSALVRRLVKQGCEVHCLVHRNRHRLTGLPVTPRTLVSVLLGQVASSDPGLPLTFELNSNDTTGASPVVVEYSWPDQVARPILPNRVLFRGPEQGRVVTVCFKSVRPLTSQELESVSKPVDTSGLQPVDLSTATDDPLPGWLR